MSSMHQVNSEKSLSYCDDKIVSLHEVRSNWILQLDNDALSQLVASQAAHVHPKSSDISSINKACVSLVSDKEFVGRLNQAGLFLSDQQVKWINKENRQIHFINQIENKALRDSLRGHSLHISRWNSFAKNQIDTLNKLLHRSFLPNTLQVALKRLGVALDAAQLKAVVDENQLQSESSPYISARNDYEALQSDLLHLNLKSIKRQFSGYLSLILNESALTEVDVDALKEELTGIVIRKAVPIRVDNPFLEAVRSVQQKMKQLERKRMLLSLERETVLTNQLIQRIDQLLLRMSKRSYNLFFQQLSVLEKWVNCATVSDLLFQEIKRFAPRRVLRRAEARCLINKLHNQVLRQISIL